MSSKHFINDPKHLVISALRAVTHINPACVLDEENKTIYRKTQSPSQVSIVSGGGSGHEPAFASYVGTGLLSAAVAGTIFASPSAEQIRRCLFRHVDASKGILVIVMNYTGDVLNFGMAVEKARAAGLNVDMVVVGDDIAVTRAAAGKVGRRGIAGTVLVQKIAGALAAKGASLEEVARVARLAAANIASIAASLSHVHVPGRSKDGAPDELGSDEAEVGMGIHNESGVFKMSNRLPGVVDRMLRMMLNSSADDRGFVMFEAHDEIVILLNNLGGLSPLELAGIADEVVSKIAATTNMRVIQVLAGAYMTSLNAHGFSLSLLRLVDTDVELSLLDCLHAPSETTGWPSVLPAHAGPQMKKEATNETRETVGIQDGQACGLSVDLAVARNMLDCAIKAVVQAEPDITRYDTIAGDGDCGVGLRRGAEAVAQMIQTWADDTSMDAALVIDSLAGVIETSMDGTSGALYAIYLNALASGMRSQGRSETSRTTSTQDWARAAQSARQTLSKYTPAKIGDRTLIDALDPFLESLESTNDVAKAAAAAAAGATETKGMKASLGRTVYIGNEKWQEVPDPGAYGLATFLQGLVDGTKAGRG